MSRLSKYRKCVWINLAFEHIFYIIYKIIVMHFTSVSCNLNTGVEVYYQETLEIFYLAPVNPLKTKQIN